MKRAGVDPAHVLFDIGHLAEIEESKHKGVENGEHMRGSALADLRGIFSEGLITTVMESIFD
jgi:hypothetical protein